MLWPGRKGGDVRAKSNAKGKGAEQLENDFLSSIDVRTLDIVYVVHMCYCY